MENSRFLLTLLIALFITGILPFMKRITKVINYKKLEIAAIFFIINVIAISSPVIIKSQEVPYTLNLKENVNNKLSDNDETIAKVAEISISINDLREYFSYKPISTTTTIKLEDVLNRLDELITSEALYHEAIRKNIHQDPGIKRIIHQMLVRKLLDEEEKKIMAQSIDEEELVSYYNQFKYQFNRPEQVRLADIFISVNKNEGYKHRDEKRKKAESILSEAIEKGKRPDFAKLIMKHSDTHSKYSLGDTGFIDSEGNPLGLSPQFAKAAFELKAIGEICDHVIETEEGYHVIMLMDKRSAFHKPFEEVREDIEQRLRKKKLEEHRKTYIEKVMSGTEIQKNDKSIAKFFEQIRKEIRPNFGDVVN